jgi:plastocyanin
MRTTVARSVITTATVVVFAACGGNGAEPDPSCTRPPLTAKVQLADFEFAPACVGATTGGTIALDNTGEAPHTFTIEGTDVDVDVAAGTSAQAELTGVAAGAYGITCTYHPQMTATLVVS